MASLVISTNQANAYMTFKIKRETTEMATLSVNEGEILRLIFFFIKIPVKVTSAIYCLRLLRRFVKSPRFNNSQINAAKRQLTLD